MKRSAWIGVAWISVLLGLGLLRYPPWQQAEAPQGDTPNRTREELTVGYLPVT